MVSNRGHLPQPTKTELNILRILWENGEMTDLTPDGPTGLRHHSRTLRAGGAVCRIEIAQTVSVVIPEPRRIPRSGCEQDSRRPVVGVRAAIHGNRWGFFYPWGDPHNGDGVRRAIRRGKVTEF